MARNPRFDTSGSWHHVMNRGVARRTVFESREDFRMFLACMAAAVRRGDIEIHAFSLMSTHFHLLVRSPRGRLSDVMRRIQNQYVRWFNRRRRRDGPLFRGRFRSKPVTSLTYRHILVRYIDANPVAAHRVAAAPLYPYGSARMYMAASGPAWLERSWIEGEVRGATQTGYDGSGYTAVFGEPLSPRLQQLVELRLARNRTGADPLDELGGATPSSVLSWMRRKAHLADGTQPGLAICDPASVSEAVESGRATHGAWSIRQGKKEVDAWPQVHAGLLTELCGLAAPEAAHLLSCSQSGLYKLRERHKMWLRDDGDYGRRIAEIVVDALRLSTEPGHFPHG